jgi:DnaJ-class molecular chaperone
MKNNKQNNKARCAHCQGRGELYDGCPDALGVDTETCSACKGKGHTVIKVMDEPITFLKAA